MRADVLALNYRPHRFADVVGHAATKTVLRAMVASGRVHPALIFAGVRGTGKTSSARILAAAVNCTFGTPAERRGDACGQCESCQAVQNGTSVSVIEVDAASHGGVADVRRITDLAAYAHPGKVRVVLLDEAHSLSKAAFNALLAVLEAPPPDVIFLLVTTEAEHIPDTVRSRAMTFEFPRLPAAQIMERLSVITAAEGIAAEPALLAEIAHRAGGGLRDAVMQLDKCSRADITTAEGYLESYGLRNVAGSLIAAALAGNLDRGLEIVEEVFYRSGDAVDLTADLTAFLADMLAVSSGGLPRRARGEADAAARVALAGRTSPDRMVAAVKVLWDLKSRLRALDSDPRGLTDMAVVLITEAMKSAPTNAARKPAMPIQPVKSAVPLTLAEMAGLSQQS